MWKRDTSGDCPNGDANSTTLTGDSANYTITNSQILRAVSKLIIFSCHTLFEERYFGIPSRAWRFSRNTTSRFENTKKLSFQSFTVPIYGQSHIQLPIYGHSYIHTLQLPIYGHSN